VPATPPSILDILTHTPIWVWGLFAFVVFIASQSIADRTVSLFRLVLLPAIMLIIAATGLVSGGWGVLPAILVGIAAGSAVGWLLEREGGTRRLANGKVWLRGDWWTLAQVLLTFGVRYTATVIGVVNPALGSTFAFQLATALISSLLSAMFLGRTAARLTTYFRSPPVAA